jgi:hypothetical protein
MSQRESGYQRKPLDQRNPGMGNAGTDPASAKVHRQDLGARKRQRQDGRGVTASWFRRGGPLVLQNLVKWSTGPRTDEGKHRSRCHAVRHGLSAETVIGKLEDVELQGLRGHHYSHHDVQSAVERGLVLRLAGLLWRLRRATTIETGLFEIQAHMQLAVQPFNPVMRLQLCLQPATWKLQIRATRV